MGEDKASQVYAVLQEASTYNVCVDFSRIRSRPARPAEQLLQPIIAPHLLPRDLRLRLLRNVTAVPPLSPSMLAAEYQVDAGQVENFQAKVAKLFSDEEPWPFSHYPGLRKELSSTFISACLDSHSMFASPDTDAALAKKYNSAAFLIANTRTVISERLFRRLGSNIVPKVLFVKQSYARNATASTDAGPAQLYQQKLIYANTFQHHESKRC